MNNDNNSSINNSKNSLFYRIKNIKNIKVILVVLLVAVLLLSIDLFTKEKAKPVTMTNEEIRIANMIEQIDGINECEVYINYGKNQSFFENQNSVEGVLVVCHGEKSVINKLQILNALQKALNINRDIIEILIL